MMPLTSPTLPRRKLLASALLVAGARSGPKLPAYPADRFVDSVGVCTHLESAPYADHFDRVLQQVGKLGVRHLRDEIRPSNDVVRWRRLAAEVGCRYHLLASPETNTAAEMLAFVRALGPGAVSAIEGQNEGDSPWFRSRPSARSGWARAVVRYQRAIHAALREADLPPMPLASPTVLDYRPDDMRLLAAAAPFCDIVSLHAYVQGQQEPETIDEYAAIDWYLRRMRDPFKPGAPAMVTEAGYATGQAGPSAVAAGIYLPRMLLHFFESGIVRSFIYELMDEGRDGSDPEQSYGLTTVDGVPKPAFLAVRTLLAALADPGPPNETAPWPLAIVEAPADGRLLRFTKRDGETIVAAWRAARSWEPAARRDLAVAAAPLRLRLAPGCRVDTQLLGDESGWAKLEMIGSEVTIDIGATVRLVRFVR